MPQQSLALDADLLLPAANTVHFNGHRWDAAIIGAGPAGALCAARLARAGARVALIDPSHPREKPCGGGVTARALAIAGAEQTLDAVTIADAAFAAADRIAEVPAGSDGPLRVYARRTFDAMLLRQAAAAGAAFLPERVINVAPDQGGWQITTRRGALRASWLIGADGANSLVRKRVSRPFERADLSIACGYYLHGATSTRIEIGFEADPAGYFWSFPRRDHLAVGICAQADSASVGGLMPLVDKWMGVFRLQAEATDLSYKSYSWPIPSLRAQTLETQALSGPNWMLLGDAAGLVDPITREGIFFALQSGAFAAASLPSPDPARAYVERLRDEIVPELLLASRIRARFYGPAFIALLISALQSSAQIRGVMADLIAGEQPYRSLRQRLLRTMEIGLIGKLMVQRFASRTE